MLEMFGGTACLPKKESCSCEAPAEDSSSAARQAGEKQIHTSEASCHHTSETLASLDCKTAGKVHLQYINKHQSTVIKSNCSLESHSVEMWFVASSLNVLNVEGKKSCWLNVSQCFSGTKGRSCREEATFYVGHISPSQCHKDPTSTQSSLGFGVG